MCQPQLLMAVELLVEVLGLLEAQVVSAPHLAAVACYHRRLQHGRRWCWWYRCLAQTLWQQVDMILNIGMAQQDNGLQHLK